MVRDNDEEQLGVVVFCSDLFMCLLNSFGGIVGYVVRCVEKYGFFVIFVFVFVKDFGEGICKFFQVVFVYVILENQEVLVVQGNLRFFVEFFFLDYLMI